MQLKQYQNGGGGLFSSFLPQMLNIAGGAIGGPVGAGIGTAAGNMIGGRDIGSSLMSGVQAGIGANKDAANLNKIGERAGQAAGNTVLNSLTNGAYGWLSPFARRGQQPDNNQNMDDWFQKFEDERRNGFGNNSWGNV